MAIDLTQVKRGGQVGNGDMAARLAAMEAELAKARAEAEAAKAEAEAAKKAAAHKVYVKAGVSGTVCLYGIQRMPLALYPEQWFKVFEYEAAIRDYIKSNPDKVSAGKDDHRFDQARAESRAKFAAKSAS